MLVLSSLTSLFCSSLAHFTRKLAFCASVYALVCVCVFCIIVLEKMRFAIAYHENYMNFYLQSVGMTFVGVYVCCVCVCVFIYISVERAMNLGSNFRKRVFCGIDGEFHILQCYLDLSVLT